jgi:hypothetical protein
MQRLDCEMGTSLCGWEEGRKERAGLLLSRK